FMLGRRLVRRCGESGIAAASTAAARNQEALAGLAEIEQPLARSFVVDHRACRHQHFDRPPIGAGLVAAFAVPAAFRFMLRVVAELKKGVLLIGGDQFDVAAASAIAAARSAPGDVLLAAERQTPVPAIAGLD